MAVHQFVQWAKVCSVSLLAPNPVLSVLFCLSIGSTLKRLCLGKERSSSNYPIYSYSVDPSSFLLLFPFSSFCCYFFSLLVSLGMTTRVSVVIYLCLSVKKTNQKKMRFKFSPSCCMAVDGVTSHEVLLLFFFVCMFDCKTWFSSYAGESNLLAACCPEIPKNPTSWGKW